MHTPTQPASHRKCTTRIQRQKVCLWLPHRRRVPAQALQGLASKYRWISPKYRSQEAFTRELRKSLVRDGAERARCELSCNNSQRMTYIAHCSRFKDYVTYRTNEMVTVAVRGCTKVVLAYTNTSESGVSRHQHCDQGIAITYISVTFKCGDSSNCPPAPPSAC